MFGTLLKLAASPLILTEKIVQAVTDDPSTKGIIEDICDDIGSGMNDVAKGTIKAITGDNE